MFDCYHFFLLAFLIDIDNKAKKMLQENSIFHYKLMRTGRSKELKKRVYRAVTDTKIGKKWKFLTMVSTEQHASIIHRCTSPIHQIFL